MWAHPWEKYADGTSTRRWGDKKEWPFLACIVYQWQGRWRWIGGDEGGDAYDRAHGIRLAESAAGLKPRPLPGALSLCPPADPSGALSQCVDEGALSVVR